MSGLRERPVDLGLLLTTDRIAFLEGISLLRQAAHPGAETVDMPRCSGRTLDVGHPSSPTTLTIHAPGDRQRGYLPIGRGKA